MKILHITATHLNKYGGIPVVLEKLVEHQNKIKDVQSIVLSVRSDIKDINSPFFHFINEDNKIIDFITEYNPEVIIFHGLYFTQYVKIGKLISSNHFKYYIQPHSSFMKQGQRKGKIKKFVANRTLFHKFIKNAHGYIFLNESELKNSIFRTNNDVIIPNGININKEVHKKNNNEKVKVFFLGRIDIDHKGLDILCEGLRKVDNEHREFLIDIYGVGTDKELEVLNKYLAKFEFLKVEYKGPVYGKDKEKVFEEYDIMVLTSRYEGFPVTVLEAFSYGIPCIVSDGTNVKTMIEENKLGWGVETDSIGEDILNAICTYKVHRDSYMKRTRSYVEQHYSWEHIANSSVSTLN